MNGFAGNGNPLDEASRRILLARAERLRQRPVEEEQGLFWTAEFPLGGEAYAFPLECLVACQPLRLVTPIPLCDPHLAGIVRFQRKILTVISLAGLLGSHGWCRDPSVMLVLRLEGERLTAVDCEEIPRAATVPEEAVKRASHNAKGVAVIERMGQIPLHLLEPDHLLLNPSGGRHGA